MSFEIKSLEEGRNKDNREFIHVEVSPVNIMDFLKELSLLYHEKTDQRTRVRARFLDDTRVLYYLEGYFSDTFTGYIFSGLGYNSDTIQRGKEGEIRSAKEIEDEESVYWGVLYEVKMDIGDFSQTKEQVSRLEDKLEKLSFREIGEHPCVRKFNIFCGNRISKDFPEKADNNLRLIFDLLKEKNSITLPNINN